MSEQNNKIEEILGAALTDCAKHPRKTQRQNIVKKALAKVNMARLAAAPAPPVSAPIPEQVAAEKQDIFAVRFIEQRAAQYLRDHASIEPDTGAVVFEFGEAGREYHYTLVELAENIRGALGNEKQSVTDVCDLPPSGWTCTRVFGHAGPCAAHPVAQEVTQQAAKADEQDEPDHPALTDVLDGILTTSGWAKYHEGEDIALDREAFQLIFKAGQESERAPTTSTVSASGADEKGGV